MANLLRQEVDTVLKGDAITFADVKKLPYTSAVINETLRLYPPVPFLAREAMEDADINGQHFKKGSIVIVAPWLLHRNPELWPDADVFRPERHLESAKQAGGERRSKYSYIPFSIGPRICAGLTFGETEAILSLAVLAKNFKLDLKPGTDVQPLCHLTLRPGETLPMTVQKRGG